MNGNVLIIEDDKDISELMKLSLTTKGIDTVQSVFNIEEAKNELLNHHYQVILLDLNLKSEDGYQLLKYIDLSKTAVIVVTAKTTHIDVYKGFENGAVDYIKKPFDPMELYYRVSLHLNKKSNPIYTYHNLKINFNSMEVYVNNALVNLTNREYQLLTYLINNKNRVLTKDQLYTKVWGYDTGVDDNTLMVHIRTLRKKIETNPNEPKMIKTVRGKGYMFKEDAHE
ncbi:response regulator transcription factor [Staphylococcus sp. NRL 16/872]|uniref:response regulator transcription factor n=1 Tax=Staphylococcus sp. NRL 16/872 TaxID=2930131 RepID=UPI001FB2C385|nr:MULTISPECIES: response regulator transcription factor [unclassified Staphylococcus]MCJ1655619.1 response regulator transcription factor [Staphylococcus sp. NRL 21/187]MCJ1661442.1 response regulator transcription factor [Staphylococcus sp. NRL 18/288]MCJ1667344.1 response regulator transcription factor [Staphylococcus sp. NRL 19/737]WEN69825.1 response regulator transcription factor [Staphylococcus sp. NRL 16/872]